MARSTLDPDNPPARRPNTPPGHDTKSLGPSDSSDSGSDVAGPGVTEGDQLNLGRGTNEDMEAGPRNSADAGASVGDLGMDENSDRFGTGEHLTAGREPNIRPNADRDADRVVGPGEAGLGRGLDQAEEGRLGTTDEAREKKARR